MNKFIRLTLWRNENWYIRPVSITIIIIMSLIRPCYTDSVFN